MRVTFDTNTLKDVITPENKDGKATPSECAIIHDALRSGRIEGYFSEAVISLDAIGRDDKVDMISGMRIISKSEDTTLETGGPSVTITVGAQWPRLPIHDIFYKRVEDARLLGMRAMMGPRRMGFGLAVTSFGDGFYVPFSTPEELIKRGEKANEVDARLRSKGLGLARAMQLGMQYSKRDGKYGEWWPQGLNRARDPAERKQVRQAINEWADGDAVAAHIGHGNDLFCTEDYGGSSRQQSVLHPTHRQWLKEDYGIVFVSLSELATQIAP